MTLIYRLNILQDNTRYQLELPFSYKYTAFTAIPNATPIQKNSTQTTFCQREFVRDILMLSFLSALDQEAAWVCYIHKYTDSQEINGDETLHLSSLKCKERTTTSRLFYRTHQVSVEEKFLFGPTPTI
jgi:hypothetical protein